MKQADEQREAFEAWLEADAMPSEADWFKRDPTDPAEYDSSITHFAWKAWQAALAAALPPAAVQAAPMELVGWQFRYVFPTHKAAWTCVLEGRRTMPNGAEVMGHPESHYEVRDVFAGPVGGGLGEGTLTAGKQAEPYSWAADGMRRDPDGNWVLREAPFLLQKEEGDSALLAYLESQKFHPSASHVPPDYRDGYNHALRTVIERIRTNAAIATRQGEKP